MYISKVIQEEIENLSRLLTMNSNLTGNKIYLPSPKSQVKCFTGEFYDISKIQFVQAISENRKKRVI